MHLVIDKGNTAIKYGGYLKGKNIFEVRGENALEEVKKHIDPYTVEALLFSDVSGELSPQELLKQFTPKHLLRVSDLKKFPFRHSYKTPHTLGEDRIALVAAAHKCYPKLPVLVIDAGSCITFDFLDADGEYHGGAISPGISMRFRSMEKFTGKLPLGSIENFPEGLGKSTHESLAAGVLSGILFEIEGRINQLKSQFSDLTVILTGGDAELLSKRLKNPIFAHPNFLLEGLDHLLSFNINE